jgi:pilus assembly protein CpaB
MRPNIFKPFRALAKLADDSDKARINSAFAFFSMKRRIIAAMLAILGVLVIVGATRSSAGTSVKTLVATREILSGAVIIEKDVALRDLPIHVVADGSFHAMNDAIGQIAVGEVITDARVVAPSLLSESGLVAIAITLNDSANAQLVHAGDHVDVLASQGGAIVSDGAAPARLVASDVEVLSTKTHESKGVVVLAVTASEARAIAGVDDRITLVLRGL